MKNKYFKCVYYPLLIHEIVKVVNYWKIIATSQWNCRLCYCFNWNFLTTIVLSELSIQNAKKEMQLKDFQIWIANFYRPLMAISGIIFLPTRLFEKICLLRSIQ